MAYNGDGVVSHLIKDWIGVIEEEKVCVQVSEHRNVRVMVENKKGERGGACEIVFNGGSVRLSTEKNLILTFELLKADEKKAWEIHVGQKTIGKIIHAETPETEGRAMLFEGVVKSQYPREIMGVKIGAEMKHPSF
jgi:hypothetical protein